MQKSQVNNRKYVEQSIPAVKNMKLTKLFDEGVMKNRFNSHSQGQVAKSGSNLRILFAVWHGITCHGTLSKDDSDIKSD